MSLLECPQCHGAKTVPVEKPVSMTEMGIVQEKCELCDGLGWIEQDLMPQVLERLDQIVEILKEIKDGGKA